MTKTSVLRVFFQSLKFEENFGQKRGLQKPLKTGLFGVVFGFVGLNIGKYIGGVRRSSGSG